MTTTEQDIQIGDRVLCKFHGVLATVDHFGIHKGKKTYIVKYDEQRVRADGSRYQFEEYFRYGLTKNYDENGMEIDGNAAYYREELLADFWGDDKTPRVFQFGSSKITAYPPTTGSKFPQSWHVFEKKGEKEKVDETYRSLENLADYLVLLYNEQGTENKSLVLTDYEDYFCDDNHSESESMNGFQLGEVVYDQLGEIGIIGAFYGKGEVRLDSNGVTNIVNIRKCPSDIAAITIKNRQKIRNKALALAEKKDCPQP